MLITNINIASLLFDYTHNVEIKSSWREMTDTCTIQSPRKIANGFWNNKGVSIDSLIQRGNPVTVQLGYGGSSLPSGCGTAGNITTFSKQFTGFVQTVKPTIPVIITCEDNMFQLKNLLVKPKQFKSPTLNQILDYCNISSVMPYQTLGTVTLCDFIIDHRMTTALRVLQCLKDDLKLYSFIRNGVLIVGQPYDASGNAPVHNLTFGQNIADYGSLQYMDAADINISLDATSINSNGQNLKVTVGDSDGDKRTRFYYNVTDIKALTAMANRDISLYKYSGYRGHLTIWGQPNVNHGDIVNLSDPDFNDRTGQYYIDSVRTEWGLRGFRQHIELGPLASAVYNINTTTNP